MNVCVVGLGKIGLPFAVQVATSGNHVFGVDISQDVVDLVNNGFPPFPGEPLLDEKLRVAINNNSLEATTDISSAVANSKAVIVLVPLITDEFSEPDFKSIDEVTESIGASLTKGTLVSYETTLPVGTTRNRFAVKLSELSGCILGRDLFVVYSPERVFSGRVFKDLRSYPKLVGGVNEESTDKGVHFYESILEFDRRPELPVPNGVWAMESSEAAELAKLAETTYRNVNIGLANEFAEFAEDQGIDIYEVIRASNSQPFSHIHQPGIAVGGHCIPVYPRFYLSNDPNARIPAAAIEVNELTPFKKIEKIVERLGSIKGLKAVVLGASYRGGVKETAFSGVFGVSQALEKFGAKVQIHDPFFTDSEISSLGFSPYHFGQKCEIAVLQADHAEYLSLKASDMPGIQIVFDGRNFLDPDNWENVVFLQIGKNIKK